MRYFFVDSFKAYHFSMQVNPDGSKQNRRDSEPFIIGMSCQMSYEGDDSASPKGQATFPQQRGIKLFVKGINLGFKRGDWVVIHRKGGVVYEGSIGEPKVYDRLIVHTEITLEAWSEAKSDG